MLTPQETLEREALLKRNRELDAEMHSMRPILSTQVWLRASAVEL